MIERRLWVVVLLAALAAEVRAGEAAAPAALAPAAEENLVQLNFPENLEVKVLVDYVAKRLGMNVLYDEAVLKKRITIAAPARVPADSLRGLLASVLRMTGLALVDADQPGWKRIVESKDLGALAERIAEDPAALKGAPAASVTAATFMFASVA